MTGRANKELWTEIRVRVPRHCADVASLALIEAGAGGVEIEDPAAAPPPGVEIWVQGRPEMETEAEEYISTGRPKGPTESPDDLLVVKALYPPERGAAPVRQVRRQLVRLRLEGGGAPAVTFGRVPSADWEQAWKSGFHTIKAGPRLVIRPAWEEYHPAVGEAVVSIDPGLAFGTGTHPTTLMCLRLLEQTVEPGEAILDAGTGSAILAIAAVKLGAARVLAVDADPLAIRAARQNVELNGVADRVSVELGDVSAVLPPGVTRQVWDGILFNISTDFILAHVGAMFRHSGRWTVISGYPEHRRGEVLTGLARAGWPATTVTDILQDGWGAVLARKQPPGPR